VTWR